MGEDRMNRAECGVFDMLGECWMIYGESKNKAERILSRGICNGSEMVSTHDSEEKYMTRKYLRRTCKII